MKYEWRKHEKEFYGVKQKPEILDLPSQQFIMINGNGNPNDEDFSDRVSTLYSVAYSIKRLFKSMIKSEESINITDFTVYPLEGIWKKLDEEKLDKTKLKYTIMIKQPDFITQEIFANALENVKKKKPNVLYDEIYFNRIKDGKSIQILHVGSYDDESMSFKQMYKFANELGLSKLNGCHREIYLNNKNKTAEDKLKTILRYSVK